MWFVLPGTSFPDGVRKYDQTFFSFASIAYERGEYDQYPEFDARANPLAFLYRVYQHTVPPPPDPDEELRRRDEEIRLLLRGKKVPERKLPKLPSFSFDFELQNNYFRRLFVLTSERVQRAVEKGMKEPDAGSPDRLTLGVWEHRTVKHIYRFNPSFHIGPPGGRDSVKTTKMILVDEIVPSFDEPFWVVPRDKSYFFVTDSGKLFVSRPVVKGKRIMEPVWNDPDRPILGALTDTNKDTHFLFGRVKKGKDAGKSFFFEVSDRPQAEFYNFDPAETRDAPEPLRTAVEYGLALVRAKKVTLQDN